MDDQGCCPHGVYVGGMGPDYMCPRCEIGDEEVDDIEQTVPSYKLAAVSVMLTEDEITDLLLVLSAARIGPGDPAVRAQVKLRKARHLFREDLLQRQLKAMEG
jgi:hypothetical protein